METNVFLVQCQIHFRSLVSTSLFCQLTTDNSCKKKVSDSVAQFFGLQLGREDEPSQTDDIDGLS